MFSTFPPVSPSKVVLDSLRDELKGNIFQNVDGFFDKYFQKQPLAAVNQEKLEDIESAKLVGKLADSVLHGSQLESLTEWLEDFQTLFFTGDQAEFRFRSQPIGNMTDSCLYLETSDPQSAAGSTRVVGEFHRESASATFDDDDAVNLGLCWRAQEIFKSQPARIFVHGFLVRGTALELWRFDRSGAYSSNRFDLIQEPDLLFRILVSYTFMSDVAVGFNTFVKRRSPGSNSFVTFDQHKEYHLQSELIATTDCMMGPGTACFGTSTPASDEPGTVIKFSWRKNEQINEVYLLQRVRECKIWGVIQLVGYQDLVSIEDLRQGLRFPNTFVNRTFSCIATIPLGRPIRLFTSIRELLEALRDLVRALQSLHLKARILHRDVAIKNLIIAPQQSADSPKGVLLDLNYSLDLDNVQPVELTVGSDGFMAIGVLWGQRHTYRHDLESLFYVFLWLAITNDREHDEANDILKGLPKTSRLWKWSTMDFLQVGKDKAADMSPDGFEGILDEFSSEFIPFKSLARDLHAIIFPVRDGMIFLGADEDPVAIGQLYDDMADAFDKCALKIV